LANRDTMKAASAEWRASNIERHRELSREWSRKNKARCQRNGFGLRLRKKYGLTRAQYDALIERWGRKCGNPRCANTGSEVRHGKLCVDHDHATGLVRGILCHGCNIALGNVRESVDRLVGLTEYLAITARAEVA
jgi:hypothetical protein